MEVRTENTGQIDDQLVILLRDAGHVLRRQYEGRGSQSRILILLRELEPVTQRALTERIGIQPGSASEVLGKLESGGMISRTPSRNDRRTMDISLTPAGHAAAEEALRHRHERHRQMFSVLSDAEKETLCGLLQKLNADWAVQYPQMERSRCGRRNTKSQEDDT